MLLDYSKMPGNQALSFVTALHQGIDKETAMRYYRIVITHKIRDFKTIASSKGYDLTLKVFSTLGETFDIKQLVRFMDKYGLDIDKHLYTISNYTNGKLKIWQEVIKHTSGKFIPQSKDAYEEYLRYLTGHYEYSFAENCVLEACHLANRKIPNLRGIEDQDTIDYLVRCILKNIDVDIYLNLGLTSEELSNTLKELSTQNKRICGKHLGLKLSKIAKYVY